MAAGFEFKYDFNFPFHWGSTLWSKTLTLYSSTKDDAIERRLCGGENVDFPDSPADG